MFQYVLAHRIILNFYFVLTVDSHNGNNHIIPKYVLFTHAGTAMSLKFEFFYYYFFYFWGVELLIGSW